MCSALDPDKGTELELTVYTLTVHDGGVNQGLCAESKMYIDDLRVKCEVGWGGVHVHATRCLICRQITPPETIVGPHQRRRDGCAAAPLGSPGDDMRWNPNDDGINFNP